MEISVVLCTYNGAKFIAEQLDSIINQTFPVKEILVFDDCSTDDTFQILQEYESRHPIIKAHRNKHNLGFNKNFEQALRSASSDAVAISDQDDIWVNTKLEKMMHAWDITHPLIYCRSYYFTDTIPENAAFNKHFIRFNGTDGKKLFYYNSVSGHALICKREFLSLVLPFKEKIMYDWWMAVVAAYNGGVQHFPEILVFQRVHSNNITVYAEKVAKKKQVEHHNAEAIRHNKAFATAPNITEADKAFSEKFASLLERNRPGRLNFQLFLFLLKHRKTIFYHKQKPFIIISQIKYSFRIASY